MKACESAKKRKSDEEQGRSVIACRQHQRLTFGLAIAGSTGSFLCSNLVDLKSAQNISSSLQVGEEKSTVKHHSLGNNLQEKSKMD